MRRRQFICNAAASGLAISLARSLQAFPTLSSRNGIGLQLWTVRNQMAEDQSATLKAIAEAGYAQVELMNVLDSSSIVREAMDLGLKVRSAFFNWESIASPGADNVPPVEKIIDQAKDLGLEYLVFGYIGKAARDTASKIRRIVENANRAAEKISAAGMKMSYHNHAFEFEKIEGEKTSYDLMLEGFDAESLKFELDVFWAAIGGYDPVDLLKKMGSRVNQVHLKDLKAGTETIFDESQVPSDAFQEVGDGILDFNAIIELATANGVTQFHVEQDESPDPIASIGQSIRYVHSVWS